jgi:hypothetical protein
LRGLGTRAPHVGQIKVSGFDEFAETPGCSGPKLRLRRAAGVVDLGGIEAYEPDVGALAIDLDAVPVEN